MKLKELVMAYKLLDDAKIKTMEDKDAIIIIKNRKVMRPYVESYDALLEDANEKFKPEDFEYLKEKVGKWDNLTDEEKMYVNRVLDVYKGKVEAVCKQELDKDIDIKLDKLSEEGALKIVKENDWQMNKLDLLKIMLE